MSDLIRRDDLTSIMNIAIALHKKHPNANSPLQTDYELKLYESFLEAVEAVPAVAQDRKNGHWIWDRDKGYQCSVCGCQPDCNMYMHLIKYCPHCGSRIEAQ